MRKKYGAVCVRSAGSHGACDLLCGNGSQLYAVQVKSGRRLSKVSWKELEDFAEKFKAIPLVLYKPDYKPFVELQTERKLTEALARHGVRRRL
jgi:Holliday junction resolvase